MTDSPEPQQVPEPPTTTHECKAAHLHPEPCDGPVSYMVMYTKRRTATMRTVVDEVPACARHATYLCNRALRVEVVEITEEHQP